MKSFTFILFLLTSTALIGQITLGKETLPDFDEELEYFFFEDYGDDGFKASGENVEWTFSDFNRLGQDTERYADINSTIYADTFPDANMIVSVGPFEAAATRSDEGISITGLTDIGFGGFSTGGAQDVDPFALRQVPMTYGDTFQDEFDIEITISASLLPGIDSIPVPIPGATIDSIRVTISTFKEETATGWGTLDLEGEEYDVLKVNQLDSTGVKIEVLAVLFGTQLWIDAGPFLGDMAADFGLGNQSTLTHKFVSAEHKFSLVEFIETEELDTLGVVIGTQINGRLGVAARPVATQEVALPTAQPKLYPIPASDILYIHSDDSQLVHTHIYTLQGQLAKSISIEEQSAVRITGLDNGIYIMESADGQQKYYSKFLVKR